MVGLFVRERKRAVWPELGIGVAAAVLLGMLMSSKILSADDSLVGGNYAGVCANCHGPKGISPNPMVPSLAGQDRTYLIEQLQAFRNERRRHAAMEGILINLSDPDMAYMGSYYADQPPMAGKGITRKTRGGAPLYNQCQGCHGERGEGRKGVPRLAGQQAIYLEKALRAYQTGERSAPGMPGMSEAVRALTPAQIKTLSRFVSDLK